MSGSNFTREAMGQAMIGKQDVISTRKFHSLLLCAAASCAIYSTANAQAINHDSLQTLFGEPVTRSATGKPQRASEAPATIQIITAEEIRRAGAYTIPQVLERVAGLDIIGSNITQQSLGVRGFAIPFATQTLVMINGRQVFHNELYEVEWYALPVNMEDIQQIEVVKGPATALFGFNAFRGVVNIITKNPLQNPMNYGRASAGNFDHRQYTAGATAMLSPTVALRISAEYRKSDQFLARDLPGSTPEELAINNELASRSAERTAVMADLAWQIDDRSNFRFELNRAHGTAMSQWEVWSNVFTDQKVWSARGAYSIDSSWGVIDVNAYRNEFSTIATPNFSGVPIPVDASVTVLQIEDVLKPSANHTLRFSTEFRRSVTVGESYGPGEAEFGHEAFSGSVMWDWSLSSNLSVTNSVRVDRTGQWKKGGNNPGVPDYIVDAFYDRDMSPLALNSYLTWRPTDQDTLRLTVGRAAQLTSPCLSACQAGSGGAMFLGTPDLPLSRITAYEVAYDRSLEEIDGQARIAVWHQRMSHNKAFSLYPLAETDDLLIFPTIDAGKTSASGFEVEIQGKFNSSWYWQLDYGFVDIEDSPSTIFVDGEEVIHHSKIWSKSTSKHRASAKLGFVKGAWEGEAFARHYSSRHGYAGLTTTEVPVPAYTTLNARLAYSFNEKLTVSLEGANLADRNHTETNGTGIGTRYSLSLSARF